MILAETNRVISNKFFSFLWPVYVSFLLGRQQEDDPRLAYVSKKQSILVNQTFQINCVAQGSRGKPTVRLLKILSQGREFEVQTGQYWLSHEVSKAKKEDGGIYVCELQSGHLRARQEVYVEILGKLYLFLLAKNIKAIR